MTKLYLYLSHFPRLDQDLHDGVCKAMHGLAAGLACSGASVTILCEGPGEHEFRAASGYSVRCFQAPRSRWPFATSPALLRYLQQRESNAPVILNGVFNRKSNGLARALRRCRIPYIVAPHDPYNPAIFAHNPHLKWPYWYLLERPMLKKAQAVQILDARHEQHLRRLGVFTPVAVAPNGFEPRDLLPESHLRWRLDGAVRLLFLGRLSAYNKGLDLLIQAMACTPALKDASLTIQGPDRGDRHRLQAQAARLGIESHVRFLDPEFDRMPTEIISNYDIFCLPSRFEGFGLAALEAMLAARVLLVSDSGGIATHVKASSCGLVTPADTSSIASALTELVNLRSHWPAMGLRGRHYASEHLQWDRIAANLLEQYRRIIPHLL